MFLFSFHACGRDDDDAASTNGDKRPIEELFKTDNVFPQEKGELEVGLSSVYQNNSAGDRFSIPISLEYGLTDQWQAEAEWNTYTQFRPPNGPTMRGIGDLELGTQYSFLNIDDSLFHITPRFSVELPLGDVNKDLSDGFVEYEPAIIFARDIPQWHHTQLFTEVGLDLVQRVKRPSDPDDAEPSAHEFTLGAGFFTLFSHGAATFEFNWRNNRWNHHGNENTLYVTPGLLWRFKRNIELGIGVPVGLNRLSDRFGVVAHIVCEF